MEPDDLLCSRNARPEKGGIGSSQTILLALRGRTIRMCSLDARLCGLTETILKSRMSENSPPENDGKADKRISGRGWQAAVSIQLVQTRRSRCM